MKQHESKKLPLSHLVYRNSQIDADKAENFIVYHYPLLNNYHQDDKESQKYQRIWEERIDNELDSKQFSYLMKPNGNQFGLYVALQNANDKPPCILDAEKQPIIPERVHYSPLLNPVWIRLIMRSLSAFGGHCKGAYSLGRPLLKVDSWKNGVNAISLDCRTQQLNDDETVEIALFYTNVPLRPILSNEELHKTKKPLWIYDKNNVLVRWYLNEKKPTGILFKEIPKSKNARKQRPFLDLSSPDKFMQSWPMILKPIQDEFIRFASNYGFQLFPKTLNLEPLSLKTKYKSSKAQPKFSSLDILGKIKIIDLRVNTHIACKEIIKLFDALLIPKGINIDWEILSEISHENLQQLKLQKSDRVLILIDQEKGIENDRYLLTRFLAKEYAIQHINVNPYYVYGDPIGEGILIESDNDDDPVKLYPSSDNRYYTYDYSMLDNGAYKEVITIKLEVVLKELELKRLLINPNSLISEVLPLQKSCLNETTIVISDGYFFTVYKDRPILIPFDPTDRNMVKKMDEYLSDFNTSIDNLLQLIDDNWPYAYRKKDVTDEDKTIIDKQKNFTQRITLILSKKENNQVAIMMQDPLYDQPHILPLGMEDVYAHLQKKQKIYPISNWNIDNIEKLENITNELCDNGVLSSKKAQRFLDELPHLFNFWQNQLALLYRQNETSITYHQIKKAVIQQWLTLRKKKIDTSISGCLDTVLSRYFNKPLNDVKRWMTDIPGIQRLWHDKEQGYFIVGGLASPKNQLIRQPSIRQWHSLQGKLDIELLTDLLDVDWVRMNQLAGRPCVATLIKRWKEINFDDEQAMLIN